MTISLGFNFNSKMSKLAQLPTKDLGQIGGDGIGFGPFSQITSDPVQAIKDLATGISNVLAFITIVASLWFAVQLIFGAFQWLSSGGDKARIENARNRLFHAFMGLTIVVASWAIIGVVGRFFGLDPLLTNPERIACSINPKCPPPE